MKADLLATPTARSQKQAFSDDRTKTRNKVLTTLVFQRKNEGRVVNIFQHVPK
jgi:hypothetical protein